MADIQLNWANPNAGNVQVDGMRVFRSNSTFGLDSLPALLVELPHDATSFLDETAEANAVYFYGIVAFVGAEQRMSIVKSTTTGVIVVPDIVPDISELIAMFGGGEQGFIHDPSDQTTLYLEYPGLTQAGSGDVVGQVSDLTGNGHNAAQGTAALKPILETDGAFWWLKTDGVDDVMSIPASAALFKYLHDGTGGEIIMAVRLEDTDNDLAMLIDNAGGSTLNTGTFLYFDDRNSTNRNNHLRKLVVDGNAGIPVNSGMNDYFKPNIDSVIGSFFQTETGNDSGVMVDGQVIYAGVNDSPSTGNALNSLVFYRKSNGAAFHAKLRDYFKFVIDRVLTDEERATVVAYATSLMPISALDVELHSFDAGSRVEWFVDQSNIDASTGVTFDVNRPTKHAGNPLSEPIGANLATHDYDKYYPSVILKDGTYRAWMGVYDSGFTRQEATYSTSLDGDAWTKPNLGQVNYGGNTDNNLIAGAGYDPTVLWNGTEFVIQFSASAEPGGTVDSNHAIYTSADGLTGLTLQKQLTAAFYEEFHGLALRSDGKYISYYTKDHGADRRKIGAFLSDTTSLSGAWTDQGTLIGLSQSDVTDQIYNFTAVEFHGVLYGIACRFDDNSERIWMDLFTSPASDGLTWTPQKGAWIPNGKYGDYDGGMAVGKQITNDGTTLKVFYGGSVENHIHAGVRDSRLCSADLPSGRLGVVRGAGGTVTTTSFTASSTLKINAVASGGNLSVELLDPSDDSVLAGFAKADCDNLDGDNSAKIVTWGGVQIPTDQAVKIKFYLDA